MTSGGVLYCSLESCCQTDQRVEVEVEGVPVLSCLDLSILALAVGDDVC